MVLWPTDSGTKRHRVAFRHLTTDHGGYLTLPAMEQVFAEFFRGDNPALPGNAMIGLLLGRIRKAEAGRNGSLVARRPRA